MDLEKKRIWWDRAVKIVIAILVGCVFGPLAAFAIGGIVALAMLLLVSEIIILFAPVVAAWLANKRLQALKAVAAANPIETYENQYLDKEKALEGFKQAMTEYYTSIQEVYRTIESHYEQFPDVPCKYDTHYNKLVKGLQNRVAKYKRLKKALKVFKKFIEQKKSEWRVAQSLARSNRLAKVGEDFLSTLMSDTATQTITSALDTAFAEMEASLIDEEIEAQEVAEPLHAVVTDALPAATVDAKKALLPKFELPSFDLGEDEDEFGSNRTGFKEFEPEPVPRRTRARTTN